MASEDYSIGADYTASMTEIGKRFDFQGQQLTEISKKLDEQELALYDQRAIITAHGRDLANVTKRLDKIEGRLDGIDGRLDVIDKRMDAMATKQDLEELKGQVLGAFQQLIAMIDERLPKQGE